LQLLVLLLDSFVGQLDRGFSLVEIQGKDVRLPPDSSGKLNRGLCFTRLLRHILLFPSRYFLGSRRLIQAPGCPGQGRHLFTPDTTLVGLSQGISARWAADCLHNTPLFMSNHTKYSTPLIGPKKPIP
jgi:hypothetical protein